MRVITEKNYLGHAAAFTNDVNLVTIFVSFCQSLVDSICPKTWLSRFTLISEIRRQIITQIKYREDMK